MNHKKLKTTLLANAIFSGLSGTSMLLFSEWIAQQMGILKPMILVIIGIGLTLFSGFLFYSSLQESLSKKQVKIIIWQDWLWVIGSALIIITQAFMLSLMGDIAIAVVAIIVANFAILQSKFLKA